MGGFFSRTPARPEFVPPRIASDMDERDDTDCDTVVLCIGDSLTYGLRNWSLEPHPYGEQMEKLLDRPDHKVIVKTFGVCGQVTEDMGIEMKDHVDGYRNKAEKVWVVILGGTNDIGTRIAHSTSIKYLERMHQHCKKLGMRTVALTLPFSTAPPEWWITSHDAFNEKLTAAMQKMEVPVIDLGDIVRGREEIISVDGVKQHDHLHLCADDYDEIAKRCAEFILASENRQ